MKKLFIWLTILALTGGTASGIGYSVSYKNKLDKECENNVQLEQVIKDLRDENESLKEDNSNVSLEDLEAIRVQFNETKAELEEALLLKAELEAEKKLLESDVEANALEIKNLEEEILELNARIEELEASTGSVDMTLFNELFAYEDVKFVQVSDSEYLCFEGNGVLKKSVKGYVYNKTNGTLRYADTQAFDMMSSDVSYDTIEVISFDIGYSLINFIKADSEYYSASCVYVNEQSYFGCMSGINIEFAFKLDESYCYIGQSGLGAASTICNIKGLIVDGDMSCVIDSSSIPLCSKVESSDGIVFLTAGNHNAGLWVWDSEIHNVIELSEEGSNWVISEEAETTITLTSVVSDSETITVVYNKLTKSVETN